MYIYIYRIYWWIMMYRYTQNIYTYIYWMLFEFDKVNWTVHSPHTLRWIALIWISWHQPAPQGALKQMWFYVALVLAPAVLHNVGNMPCKSSRVFRTNSREYSKVNQRRQEYGKTSNMNAACTIYGHWTCCVRMRCCSPMLLCTTPASVHVERASSGKVPWSLPCCRTAAITVVCSAIAIDGTD